MPTKGSQMAKKKTPSPHRNGAKSAKLGGPFLYVAAFCDRVLHEKDDVVSLIRIVDRMNIQGPLDEMPPGYVRVIAALGFKRGDASGKYRVSLVMRDPDGKKAQEAKAEINFDGDPELKEAGNFVEAAIGMAVSKPGLYVGEVRLNGKLYTKMPLRIRYLKLDADLPKSKK
jgi:hypothetical protein